jgi:hypothetical protein
MYKETIFDITTGTETVRDYTEAEIAEVVEAQKKAAAKAKKWAEAEAAKEVAQAKLAALGLTTNDLKALGL